MHKTVVSWASLELVSNMIIRINNSVIVSRFGFEPSCYYLNWNELSYNMRYQTAGRRRDINTCWKIIKQLSLEKCVSFLRQLPQYLLLIC